MPVKGDEVWVLTRSNNRGVIEADPLSRMAGLRFIYYDLPSWALEMKKRGPFLELYILLWQWGAYRLAARWHKEVRFDMVYHVTFSGMISGSFMGRLGIPFVVGPIGGGERAPFRLRRSMPFLSQVKELVRDFGIVFQRFSPLTAPALSAARRIYVTTPESLRLVQKRWRYKTSVQLSVGHSQRDDIATRRLSSPHPRFVFVGRLLHWKGTHLAIRALAEARIKMPTATLTIFGTGPMERWLKGLAKRAGVDNAVMFIGHIPRPKLVEALLSYSALVFPSLHDSGGLVVLEALSKGLPVVCLDLGGPGIMVNERCGVIVSTVQASESETITAIANAMIGLGTMNAEEFQQLSDAAISRAKELSWSELTKKVTTGR